MPGNECRHALQVLHHESIQEYSLSSMLVNGRFSIVVNTPSLTFNQAF
ncbi:MAG: hypothetical protein ACTSVI_16415 [Promethearchaeota archaeon]